MKMYPLSFSRTVLYVSAPWPSAYCTLCGVHSPVMKEEPEFCLNCNGMGRCVTCRALYTIDFIRSDPHGVPADRVKPTRYCEPCDRRPDLIGINEKDELLNGPLL